MTSDEITAAVRRGLAGGRTPAAIMTGLEACRAACDPPMSAVRLADIITEQVNAAARARRVGVAAPPLEERTIAGRRYTWEPGADDTPGVVVTVERITPSRSALLAEVSIDAGGVRAHGPVVEDLLSTARIGGLAAHLGKVYPMRLWHDIVGAAFRLAVESHRAGEPMVKISDPIPPRARFAIDPLASDRDPTLLFARGGSAKSYIGLAIAVTLDNPEAGVLPFAALTRHRVAYLDWEWERADHHDRLGQMLDDDQLAACGVLHDRMSGSLASQVEQMARKIEAEGITYIVIDSVALACGGDPQQPEPTLALFAAVRALGVGALLIAHLPKGSADDVDSPYGSTYWRDMSRLAWRVDCQSEAGDPKMRLALHQCKANAGGKRDPVGLMLDFAGGRLAISRIDVAATPGLQDAIPPQRRIKAALQRCGALHVADIAAETGLDVRKVEMELAKMAAPPGRTVVELSSGAWGLNAIPFPSRQNGRIMTGDEIAASLPL